MEEALLPKIAENYRLTIRSTELLHYTTRTLVLLIQTNTGAFVVKSIYVNPDRLAFILAVEQHLRAKGVFIPQTIPMENGEFIFLYNGMPFALQEYVEGSPLLITSAKLCQERGRLLGSIHARSLGFWAETGEACQGLLKWEQTYQEELQTMANWHARYQTSRQKEHQLILRAFPFFWQAATYLQRLLGQNRYFSALKEAPLEQQFLCHGDFHTGNVLWNENERRFTIIDWEFTRYDFPSVDLGRLLSIIMRNEKRWNQSSFSALLSGYLAENPLDEKQRELLYLDLAFPHLFERFLRKDWCDEMSASEIQQFLQREQEKTSFLLRTLK